MSGKTGGDFDRLKYQNDWNRKNMKRVSSDFKAEFVDEFREALTKLDLKNVRCDSGSYDPNYQKSRSKMSGFIKDWTFVFTKPIC